MMKTFIIIIFLTISYAKQNTINFNSSIGILENLNELPLAKLLKVRQFTDELKLVNFPVLQIDREIKKDFKGNINNNTGIKKILKNKLPIDIGVLTEEKKIAR